MTHKGSGEKWPQRCWDLLDLWFLCPELFGILDCYGFLMITIMDSSNRVACCIIVTFSLCKTHRNVMFKVSICEEKGNIRLDEEMGGKKSMTHAGRPGN